MSVFVLTPNLMANGNIGPAVFVKGDPSNARKCLQCVVGDTPVGITGTYTRGAPGTPFDDGYEAIASESVLIWGAGATVNLLCGTAWTPFTFLKPDANGMGQPASPGDIAGAYAFEAANAGESSLVVVLPEGTRVPGSNAVSTAVSLTATADQSGYTFVVTAADKVITLPTAAAGMRFIVIATGTGATGGSTGTTVAIQGTDTLAGNGFTAGAGKGAINTHGTAADGDWMEFFAVAANSWYVRGVKGTWARVS